MISPNISYLESLIFVTCDFVNKSAQVTLHGSTVRLPLTRARKAHWTLDGIVARFRGQYPGLDGELSAPFALDAMGCTALELRVTARYWPHHLLFHQVLNDSIWPVSETLYGPTERQAIAEISALRPTAPRVGVYYIDPRILKHRAAVDLVAQEPITIGLGLTEAIARRTNFLGATSVVADLDVLQRLHDVIKFTSPETRGSFYDAEKIYARLNAIWPAISKKQHLAPSKWDVGSKIESSADLYGGRYLLLS